MFNFEFDSEEEEMLPPRVVLYRSGTDLRQAFWGYENSHIIFQDNDTVFLLEAGDHDPYGVREIQTIAQNTDFLYNDHSHTLYYLDASSRKIMKRKITE